MNSQITTSPENVPLVLSTYMIFYKWLFLCSISLLSNYSSVTTSSFLLVSQGKLLNIENTVLSLCVRFASHLVDLRSWRLPHSRLPSQSFHIYPPPRCYLFNLLWVRKHLKMGNQCDCLVGSVFSP